MKQPVVAGYRPLNFQLDTCWVSEFAGAVARGPDRNSSIPTWELNLASWVSSSVRGEATAAIADSMQLPFALTVSSGQKRIHRVASQVGQRDETHVSQDLGHFRVTVVLAQVLDRIRIELVKLLRVVLSEQDRRRLAGILGRQ